MSTLSRFNAISARRAAEQKLDDAMFDSHSLRVFLRAVVLPLVEDVAYLREENRRLEREAREWEEDMTSLPVPEEFQNDG